MGESDDQIDVKFLSELIDEEIIDGNLFLKKDLYDFPGECIVISSPVSVSCYQNCTLNCSCLWLSSDKITLSGLNINGSILCENYSDITIQNCTITNNDDTYPCISLDSSCNSVVDNVTINCCYFSSSIVSEKSTNLQIKNSTFNNLNSSAIVLQNTSARIENCSFNQINDVSIDVICSPSTVIDSCTFNGTLSTAITGLFSTIFISKTTFDSIKHNALAFHQCTNVNITECTLKRILGTAITASKSYLFVANNTFEENQLAIHSSSETRYDILENEINNCDIAFVLYRGCFGQISYNKIHNIKQSAIVVRGATNAAFEQNVIEQIEECAFSISDTNTCTLIKNNVAFCKIAGIEVFNAAKVSLFYNKFDNTGEYAIRSLISSNVKAEKNTFTHMKTLLMLSTNGSADLRNNDVFYCDKQIEGKLSGDIFLVANGSFGNITTIENYEDYLDSPLDSVGFINKGEEIQFVKREEENDEMCFICHQKKRVAFCIPCGHKVFCDSCASERCPLCRCKSTGKTLEFPVSPDESCILCIDGHADSIVMPCGHSGMCHNCLEKWFKEHTSCPICRQENSHFRELIAQI